MKTTTTNKESKITMKKEDLVKILKESFGLIPKDTPNDDLAGRIAYTIKAYDKDQSTPKDILKGLVTEVTALLNNLSAQKTLAPIETSPKPTLKAPSKAPTQTATPKEEKKSETVKKEETKKVDEKPTTGAKPTTPKPTSKAKETAKVESTTDGLNKNSLPIARLFPKVLEHSKLGTLTACHDRFKTMEEVHQALEAGEELYVAAYWTKRHIKEYSYGATYEVPVPKEGFPHDLDTLQVLFTCEQTPRLYAISTYTEAMFKIDETDLELVECTAPDDTKFGMRYSAGLEFEIYIVKA